MLAISIDGRRLTVARLVDHHDGSPGIFHRWDLRVADRL